MSSSHLEEQFLNLWQSSYPDLPLAREVLAVPKRRFRLDFAHLPSSVAVEINGGLWVKSKHSSGVGLLRDYEKSNLLVATRNYKCLGPQSSAFWDHINCN